MTAGGRPGDALRRLLVPRIRLIPGLAAKVLDSATPPLRPSALIARPSAPITRVRGSTLAGTLCPNAVTKNGDRLDSVVRGGFSVVTTADPTVEQHRIIDQRHAALIRADAGTPLARWLDNGGATAAIVRPDFTVMHAGTDLSQLCEALPSFG